MPVFVGGGAPLVRTQALWSWNTSGAVPVVSGYPIGPGAFSPTKTGLTVQDLKDFAGVPLVYYGNPSSAVSDATIQNWLRYAEDTVEQESGLLLCQTWIASPPTLTPEATSAVGLIVNTPSQIQQVGIDYDLEDAAYDFHFPRAQDEGWMMYSLRYRPVRSVSYSAGDFSAVKNYAFIYPLLNDFFRVAPSWFVEDHDYGLVRLVPAQNVQMLPLFAMQLAFMGFAESLPGALWLQYTAGLTPSDYMARFSFVKQLVLVEATIIALSSVQGTINLGAEKIDTMVDGLRQSLQYPKSGPFGPLIEQHMKQRDRLMKMAKERVNGPVMNVL